MIGSAHSQRSTSAWRLAPWAGAVCLIAVLLAPALAAACYPTGKESGLLGRYLVYKSTFADGRESYSTRAAVAANAQGGLIWCVHDGRPEDGAKPNSVVATDANGVTLWKRKLTGARKGHPAKIISQPDFRNAMRGLGEATYLFRAPKAAADLYPSHLVTLERSCQGDDYVIETVSRRATEGTAPEREEKDRRLAAYGLLEIHYQFRDDGVLLKDRRYNAGPSPRETLLVEEGDWDQPSCVEAVG